MRALTAETLRGLWAAVATPWDDRGNLEEGMLRRNCQRLAAAGADGIYTTDSDGEFYAIELDEFKRLARSFAKAMESAKVDAAMGVTWTSTRGIIDRIRACCEVGIPNVHVGFPYFMSLAQPDVDRFWEDLARAAPQVRWIHYAHPRCGPALTGADYARLAERFPGQFIGTKLSEGNLIKLTEILMRSSRLAHLVTDPIMAVGMMMGAKGCCSYWFNVMPRWHRRYMDACLAGEWAAADACHKKLIEWELTHMQDIHASGHSHGIIGKARGALTDFLEDTGITRAPYYSVSKELRARLEAGFKHYWAAELAAEDFPGRP